MWLPAVITAELPWLWLASRVLIGSGFIGLGALELSMGWLALWLLVAAQVLQLELLRRAEVSARQIGPGRSHASWWEVVTGWPYRIPAAVERISGVEYAPGLTLDLYRPRRRSDVAIPCLVYVHGGSWGGGDPRRVFRTVVHHLAAQGWGVATIRYPLSPEATFPDHLIGVKRAILWVKTAGAESYGLDPQKVALAGGSAGAHLASLAVLTDSNYQPGFETADTSTRAAVVLYGIYDFANRNQTRVDWPVIPRRVMKATVAEAPERYREASPIDQVRSGSPPILVVHGTSDSLVPVAEAQFFVEALRAAGGPVEYLPVEKGQHAFDVVGGARTRALAVRIEQFLEVALAGSEVALPKEALTDDAKTPDPA
jgi:acetyl esterase/lipase